MVSQCNSNLKDDRPEDSIDVNETKYAKDMMEYVLEHKTIPFDMSAYFDLDTKPMIEFVPSETRCHKCDVDLIAETT